MLVTDDSYRAARGLTMVQRKMTGPGTFSWRPVPIAFGLIDLALLLNRRTGRARSLLLIELARGFGLGGIRIGARLTRHLARAGLG